MFFLLISCDETYWFYPCEGSISDIHLDVFCLLPICCHELHWLISRTVMTSRNCLTGWYWQTRGGNERRLSLPYVMWFLWKDRSAAISVSPHFPQNNLRAGNKIHGFCPSWMFLSLDATFHIWFILFLTTSPNHFRKYFQLVNNHKSSTGKGQIVCLAQCLLLFLIFFLRSVGLPALSLINHQDVVGGLDGSQCQQRHTGETARIHSTGRRLTWAQHAQCKDKASLFPSLQLEFLNTSDISSAKQRTGRDVGANVRKRRIYSTMQCRMDKILEHYRWLVNIEKLKHGLDLPGLKNMTKPSSMFL